MNRVWPVGVQSGGSANTGGSANGCGSTVHGVTPSLPWVRTGNPAASRAAGLVEVWSTIRLLTTRGSESNTSPVFWAYDDEATAGDPGPKKPAPTPSAALKDAVLILGKSWSAEPNVSWPGCRLLHEPSTVRSPLDTSGLGIWFVSVPIRVEQGSA